MDANKLKYYAERGHFGHAALLDPSGFVAEAAPQLGIPGGDLVASNTNEFGLADRLKINITPESQTQDTGTAAGPSVRSKRRSQQNEKMLGQGKSPAEIAQDELQNPMS